MPLYAARLRPTTTRCARLATHPPRWHLQAPSLLPANDRPPGNSVRLPALVVLASLFHGTLVAQQQPPVSPATQAGLTVTPKWGQSKEVQQDYERECYDRARVQTGADPARVAAADSAAAAHSDSGTGAAPGIISGRRIGRSKRLQTGALENFRKVMQACLEGGGYAVE